MKIFVTVRPNKKTAHIEEIAPTEFRVDVDAPAIHDQANRRLVELLADYFQIPRSAVSIVVGHYARKKIVEIKK